MKQIYELRVKEAPAHRVFLPNEGKSLDPIPVRVIQVSHDDPRLPTIRSLQQELRSRGDHLFSGWDISYRYTKAELSAASLLLLTVWDAFEPTGEECGTKYDESTSCDVCGAGRSQIGPLYLRPSSIPKKRVMTSSMSSERIFSEALVKVLETAGVTGVDFEPILAKNGKRIAWFQPKYTARTVSIAPPTVVGGSLFEGDSDYRDRCPVGRAGHVLGLNRHSELFVRRQDWDGSDFVTTSELLGRRSGILMPAPLVLVSQKVRQLLESIKAKGYALGVVRFAN